MAETILAIGSSIGSAAGTAGSAIGSALGLNAPMVLAPAAGGASGLGSFGLSVLQGAVGLGGVMSSIAEGAMAKQSYDMQARQAQAEGEQEKIAGMQRTSALKRELAKAVGESDVIYAASGVDIGGGVAADARQAATSRAASEISVDRSLMDARIALHQARASSYRRLGDAALGVGMIGGATKAAGVGFDIAKRGAKW